MNSAEQGILILCPFFRPNVGGVETHLDDLCKYLTGKSRKIYVLTFQPLTTCAKAPSVELGLNIEIRRFKWVGWNLFHKLERFPLFEFIYITPRLLLGSLIFLTFNSKKIDVIHAHGFNASFIVKILKPIFKKRTVISTHAIYNLRKGTFFSRMVRWSLKGADRILTVSLPSSDELKSIGVRSERITQYTYWVDQEAFKPLDRTRSKKELGLENKFIVLFVGRLIGKKGVSLLLEAAKNFGENILTVVVGDGPMAKYVRTEAKNRANLFFAGKIENDKLTAYYNAADILCVTSLYEEAFGRVIIEALFCGLPVVASGRGAIKDVLSDKVGMIVEPMTAEGLAAAVKYLFNNKAVLETMRANCRPYAAERFGASNAEVIIESYKA